MRRFGDPAGKLARASTALIVGALTSLGLTSPALAQQSNPEQTGGIYRWDGGPPKLWSFSAEAAFYYVAPSGDLTVPGETTTGDTIQLDDFNLDEPELAFFPEIHLRKDRWRLTASGFTFTTSGSATVDRDMRFGDGIALAGERVDSSLDFTTFEVTGSYRFAEYAGSQRHDGAYKLVAGLEAVGGVRYYDIDFEFDVDLSTRSTVFLLGSEASADRVFAHPVIGIRGDMEFYEDFSVDLETTLGGFYFGDHESASWDLKVQFGWRPVENFGVFAGYRTVVFHLKDGSDNDEFEWDGSLAGLFFGAQIRF